VAVAAARAAAGGARTRASAAAAAPPRGLGMIGGRRAELAAIHTCTFWLQRGERAVI
jgi:hypothetical protein